MKIKNFLNMKLYKTVLIFLVSIFLIGCQGKKENLAEDLSHDRMENVKVIPTITPAGTIENNLQDEEWMKNSAIQAIREAGIEDEIEDISMPLDKMQEHMSHSMATLEVCFTNKHGSNLKPCILVHYEKDGWKLGKRNF